MRLPPVCEQACKRTVNQTASAAPRGREHAYVRACVRASLRACGEREEGGGGPGRGCRPAHGGAARQTASATHRGLPRRAERSPEEGQQRHALSVVLYELVAAVGRLAGQRVVRRAEAGVGVPVDWRNGSKQRGCGRRRDGAEQGGGLGWRRLAAPLLSPCWEPGAAARSRRPWAPCAQGATAGLSRLAHPVSLTVVAAKGGLLVWLEPAELRLHLGPRRAGVHGEPHIGMLGQRRGVPLRAHLRGGVVDEAAHGRRAGVQALAARAGVAGLAGGSQRPRRCGSPAAQHANRNCRRRAQKAALPRPRWVAGGAPAQRMHARSRARCRPAATEASVPQPRIAHVRRESRACPALATAGAGIPTRAVGRCAARRRRFDSSNSPRVAAAGRAGSLGRPRAQRASLGANWRGSPRKGVCVRGVLAGERRGAWCGGVCPTARGSQKHMQLIGGGLKPQRAGRMQPCTAAGRRTTQYALVTKHPVLRSTSTASAHMSMVLPTVLAVQMSIMVPMERCTRASAPASCVPDRM